MVCWMDEWMGGSEGWMEGREGRRVGGREGGRKQARTGGRKQASEETRERPRTIERLECLCGDPSCGLRSDERSH